jgi:CDP-diacylglycerol--inositol 3-phosphatidyltransferase
MHSYKDAAPIVYLPVLGHLTLAGLMAVITFPVWLYKNFVNAVQLWKGSKILVGVDLTERAELRADGSSTKNISTQ